MAKRKKEKWEMRVVDIPLEKAQAELQTLCDEGWFLKHSNAYYIGNGDTFVYAFLIRIRPD